MGKFQGVKGCVIFFGEHLEFLVWRSLRYPVVCPHPLQRETVIFVQINIDVAHQRLYNKEEVEKVSL
ncbi:MAG: hypothetical protein GDA44_12295 [Prochloron sp. SP5CPC1]|nr:hypothetical protein [Candidatus Paraprochloron terpiosi SP5CPC1]